MRHSRSLRHALAIALVVATSAHADTLGCNLRWDRCYGDGGVQNRSFACDTNLGSDTMVGSFVSPADMADVASLEANLEFSTASEAVPGWWQFHEPGTCRPTSLSMSTTPLDVNAFTNCPDWSDLSATGGLADATINFNGYGANTVRLLLATASPVPAPHPLQLAQEYFTFRFTLNRQKTVGIGACEGCATPVCIVFNRIGIIENVPADSRWLSGPGNGTDSDYVTWQGGAGVTTALGSGCPAASPAKRATWSAVKSLYR